MIPSEQWLDSLVETGLDLLFPSFCFSCHQRSKKRICPSCALQLSLVHPQEFDIAPSSIPYPLLGVFEEEDVSKCLINKMLKEENFPLRKIIASYLIYQMHQFGWSNEMLFISNDSSLSSFVKLMNKMLKTKKNASSFALLTRSLDFIEKNALKTLQQQSDMPIYLITLLWKEGDVTCFLDDA